MALYLLRVRLADIVDRPALEMVALDLRRPARAGGINAIHRDPSLRRLRRRPWDVVPDHLDQKGKQVLPGVGVQLSPVGDAPVLGSRGREHKRGARRVELCVDALVTILHEGQSLLAPPCQLRVKLPRILPAVRMV